MADFYCFTQADKVVKNIIRKKIKQLTNAAILKSIPECCKYLEELCRINPELNAALADEEYAEELTDLLDMVQYGDGLDEDDQDADEHIIRMKMLGEVALLIKPYVKIDIRTDIIKNGLYSHVSRVWIECEAAK